MRFCAHFKEGNDEPGICFQCGILEVLNTNDRLKRSDILLQRTMRTANYSSTKEFLSQRISVRVDAWNLGPDKFNLAV